jgi:hypothetical protein
MKFFTAISAFFAIFCVLSASPAFSQVGQQDKFGRDPNLEEEMKEKKRSTKELEKEYDAVVKRTNRQTTSATYDPWQNIRPSTPSNAKQ